MLQEFITKRLTIFSQRRKR